MSSRRWVFATGLGIVVLLIGLAVWMPPSRRGPQLAPDPAARAAESESRALAAAGPAARSPLGSTSPTVPDSPPLEVGTRSWAEVKAVLREIIPVRDESDREDLMEWAKRWPKELEDQTSPGHFFDVPFFNPAGKELLDVDIEALEGIVREHDALLTKLGSESFPLLQESLSEYFESERFRRFWLVESDDGHDEPQAMQDDGSLYVLSMKLQEGGWICRVNFRSVDYPAFQAHLERIEELRAERTRDVRDYIAKLP